MSSRVVGVPSAPGLDRLDRIEAAERRCWEEFQANPVKTTPYLSAAERRRVQRKHCWRRVNGTHWGAK